MPHGAHVHAMHRCMWQCTHLHLHMHMHNTAGGHAPSWARSWRTTTPSARSASTPAPPRTEGGCSTTCRGLISPRCASSTSRASCSPTAAARASSSRSSKGRACACIRMHTHICTCTCVRTCHMHMPHARATCTCHMHMHTCRYLEELKLSANKLTDSAVGLLFVEVLRSEQCGLTSLDISNNAISATVIARDQAPSPRATCATTTSRTKASGS